jgi:uncharacterized membrane protein YczE
LGAIFELFTIPFIVLVPILIGISLKNLYSENWTIKSKYFFSVLFSVVSLVLISIATILNI